MLRKLHWKSLLAITLIVAVSFTVLYYDEFEVPILGERGSEDILGLRLGLDLAGGTQLIYQAGDENMKPTDNEMEGLIGTISRRIDRLGVTEPSLQRLGEDRLLIQLPGVEDVQQAKDLIGQTAQLEIIERLCEDLQCTIFKDQETGLTGDDMSRAFASQDQVTQEPILSFELKRGAAQQFATVTQRIYDSNTSESPDQLAFVLDDKVLVSAAVQSPILSGSGIISGNFSPEDARQLAIQVESGRLQIDITELSSSVIAASLGSRSLEEGLIAGLVGLALVLLFMVGYYRASGLVAGVALIFYTLIVLAIFKLIPITLTLAGLAGFILSLGMAVDANVLIFERIREELRNGNSPQASIRAGYEKAFSTIADANITTLIAACVLFVFGTGPIRGFATTLGLGIVTSMFTAIIGTRAVINLIYGNRQVERLAIGGSGFKSA